ncbi:MAG: ArsR/SmtB family transcription factor [Candidatus Brocadiia bacterium]
MRAFGDGTRLRIVGVLSRGPVSVSGLAGLLHCPPPRVSRHLRYLGARGVVEAEYRGNAMVYRLAAPAHRLHERVLAAVQGGLADVEEVRQDARRLRESAE